MGDYPALVDGVAVETSAKLVVDAAEGHLVQGLVDDDVQPVLAGDVVSGEGELDGGGVGEFRGAAKSAVDYVEALTYGLEGGVDGRVMELGGLPLPCTVSFPRCSLILRAFSKAEGLSSL